MATGFSKQRRQEIVDDFVARHGGFDARAFLREVRLSNGTHPAWSWFEWNDGRAAEEYRVEQARDFVRDLRVTFEITTTQRSVKGVFMASAPAAYSPLSRRSTGGGYRLTDPGDTAHRRDLCAEGGQALRAWLRRYSGVAEAEGVSTSTIEQTAKRLERLSHTSSDAA